MTKVHFFHGARDRVDAAIVWLQYAWSQRADVSAQQVVVFAPDGPIADRLDRQLWLQPAGSFVPHCRDDSPLANDTPVVIGASLAKAAAHRQLLNLSNEVPPEFSRFDAVIEIVSQGDDRLPARERFKFYRERGYELRNQDISGGFQQ